MRILKVLHRTLFDSVPSIHQTRTRALAATVASLLNGAFLTVTALGRGLDSAARTKHNIKRVDRLASNLHLQRERLSLYRALCHQLCQHLSQPVILIDGSDIIQQQRVVLIRAALVLDGRAIPLYESAYPLKQYNKPRTHRRFLMELSTLLPAQCVPIIVTDAGFRGPWFKAVEALGWHWVGRVRNVINYRLISCKIWRKTTDLYYRARSKPRYLGAAELSSKSPYLCHLYLYKKRKQYQTANRSVIHLAKHGTRETFAQQQRQPWLIATNLSPQSFSPKDMVRLYSKRMQIESSFRDLKSDRFGLGFSLTRTTRIDRLNILLLIGALATLCLSWLGLLARAKQWHLHFQANTVRHRHVLSAPFLGKEVLNRNDYGFSFKELNQCTSPPTQGHRTRTSTRLIRGDPSATKFIARRTSEPPGQP